MSYNENKNFPEVVSKIVQSKKKIYEQGSFYSIYYEQKDNCCYYVMPVSLSAKRPPAGFFYEYVSQYTSKRSPEY